MVLLVDLCSSRDAGNRRCIFPVQNKSKNKIEKKYPFFHVELYTTIAKNYYQMIPWETNDTQKIIISDKYELVYQPEQDTYKIEEIDDQTRNYQNLKVENENLKETVVPAVKKIVNAKSNTWVGCLKVS